MFPIYLPIDQKKIVEDFLHHGHYVVGRLNNNYTIDFKLIKTVDKYYIAPELKR